MPYCPRCGKQVRDDALFCSNCGASLKQQTQAEKPATPNGMFRRYGGNREKLREIIDKFRQKGAVSPETAMTAEELGLPPRFEEAMKRRLGRSGIIIEVNDRYYLSEERLKQLQKRRLR